MLLFASAGCRSGAANGPTEAKSGTPPASGGASTSSGASQRAAPSASKGPRVISDGEAALAARELDVIAEGLDKYGALSSSAAIVLRRPENFFGFRLDLTPKEIFAQQERISATSTVGDFESLQVRVAVALNLLKSANEVTDPVEASKLQGQAEGVLAGALVDEQAKQAAGGTPGEDGKDGEEDDDTGGAAPPLPKPGAATKPRDFTGEGGLAAGAYTPRDADTLDIPLRQLIQQTFDDHTVLRLFEWFSAPDHSAIGKNKEVFAALLNVSCRPGRLTYSGYFGEVAVEVGYARAVNGGGVKEVPDRYPLSFAVFPAIDSQLIDERTSLRRQFALSLLLEGMLKGVNASGQLDYVRQLNRDIASLSAKNAVVGFNMGGRYFGWRFSPRLVAQTDPGATETGSGSLLEPQTIPAVVLIVADWEDLAGYSQDSTERTSGAALGGGSGSGFDHFIFKSSMRWMPAPAPSADASWVPFAREWHSSRHPRLAETEFVDWALRARRVEQLIEREEAGQPTEQDGSRSTAASGVMSVTAQLSAPPASGGAPQQTGGASSAVASLLRKRLDLLEAAGLGADHVAAIPANRASPSFSATPALLDAWTDRETVFVLPGQRVAGAILGATVGGLPARAEALGDSAIRVTIPAPGGTPDANIHVPLTVVHTGGTAHLANVRFSQRSRQPVESPPSTGRLIEPAVSIGPGPLAFEFDAAGDVPAFLDKVKAHVRPALQPNAAWTELAATLHRITPTRVGLTRSGTTFTERGWYEVDLRSSAADGQPTTSRLRQPGGALFIPSEAALQPKGTPAEIQFDAKGAALSGLELGDGATWELLFELEPTLRGIGRSGGESVLRLSGGGRDVELPLTQLPSGAIVVTPAQLTSALVFGDLPPEVLTVKLALRTLVHKPSAGAVVIRPANGEVTFKRPAPPEKK